MRGADVVAVGERGQALDVYPEQAGERVGLGLAELGELPRDVLHRAVPLTQLRAEPRYAGGGRPDRGGVAVGGQGLGEGFRARRNGLAGRLDPRPVPALELAEALLGEGADGAVAEAGAQVAQRRRREVVVAGRHHGVAAVGGDVPPRGPPPAAPGLGRLPDGDEAVGRQGVEVTADGCRRQPEPAGEHAGAQRAALEHGAADTVTRARVRRLSRLPRGRRLRDRRGGRHRAACTEFHTTIVSLFALPLNSVPLCAASRSPPDSGLAERVLDGVPICGLGDDFGTRT